MSGVREMERLARSFELHLGAPHDAANAVSFASALLHDDREQFSHEGMAHLRAWGLQEHQVPVEHGGAGGGLADDLELLRLLARRDASLATSVATTALGFMPIWVGGSDEQKRRYGGEVCRGAAFSWALSERDHGSDLMATETRARRVGDGWALDGEKWPIGNSALGDHVTVFARTGDDGPLAFSVFVVERATVPARCVAPLRRERLQGVRSIDNGGLRFADCRVPSSALVGEEGAGLEIALKASFAARAVAPAIALGCADTALRLTLDFVTERVIFGRPVVDVPHTRRRLADCFADLMVADAVAVVACRTLHVAPDQASVAASVAKFLVPTLLERTVSELAAVVGARHYLRSDARYGVFHKAMRDLWIAHFAEGNTVVNLNNLALQLPRLAEVALEADAEARAGAERRAAVVFDLDAELPPFAPARIDLRSRHGDDALTALPAAIERLRELAAAAPPPRRDRLLAAAGVAARFVAETARVRAAHDALRAAGRGHGRSAEAHALAEQYCVVHAAAAVVQLAVHSAGCLCEPLDEPAVLLLCLARLWRAFHPLDEIAGADVADEALDVACRLHQERRSFSHRQLPLADGIASGPIAVADGVPPPLVGMADRGPA